MLSRQAIRRFPYVLRATPRHAPLAVVQRTLATLATPPSPNDPFANGTNAYYAEEMYRHWRQDPQSVHASWATYFSGMEYGLPSAKAFQPPPGLITPPADGAPALHAVGGAELDDHLKVKFAFFVSFSSLIGSRSNSWCAHTKSGDTTSPNWTPLVFLILISRMFNLRNSSSAITASQSVIWTSKLLSGLASFPTLLRKIGRRCHFVIS